MEKQSCGCHKAGWQRGGYHRCATVVKGFADLTKVRLCLKRKHLPRRVKEKQFQTTSVWRAYVINGQIGLLVFKQFKV
jgi:hypothetical protein